MYLSLIGNTLNGNIPPELGNLNSLTYLDLRQNDLSGSIPPELGNLNDLEYLDVGRNNLNGSIPSEIWNLNNVYFLDLGSNDLSGSIPPEIANMTALEDLSLGFNSLSGNIPAEMGTLTNLKFVDMSNANFSGSIPPELENLDDLAYLDLSLNDLSGSIPPELGSLNDLVFLLLGGNNLSGNIPPEIGGMNNLQYLTVNNNQLSGCYDLALMSLCTQLDYAANSEISYGNNFDATWDDFCITGTGTCVPPGAAKIQAHIFYDINQNKIPDNGEPINTNFSISIMPDNSAVFSNPEDTLIFYLLPSNYTTTLNINDYPDWQLTTDSLSYFLSLEAEDCDTITFGVYPVEQVSGMQNFISSPPTRCNELITFDVSTKNLGTTTTNGTLWLEVDDNILATEFIDTPDTTVSSNRYGWFFEDLFPSQSINRQISLQIPGPLFLGSYLFFDVDVDFEDENGVQNAQTFTYETEVRCSYDPNDKLVNPSRHGDYTLFDENLIYTIRFQNTGNDIAYDVVIRDTLDVNLNVESFNVLGSSHADKLQTSMTTEGILTFEFRDIFLPDSTSNLEGSQGYVTYMISAIDGLAENTPITNSAGIYFDLNPPIITNTTQNIMVSELPVVSTNVPHQNPFTVYPIPAKDVVIFDVPNIAAADDIILYDITGKQIHRQAFPQDKRLAVSHLNDGMYIYRIFYEDEVYSGKIVVE